MDTHSLPRPARAQQPSVVPLSAERWPTSHLADGSIEAIAHRVAELLRPHHALGLVDAVEIAQRFGVHRSWVYAHAHELGAVRLGSGPKARLRFDLHRVAELLARDELTAPDATPRRREARPRRSALPAGVELLQGRSGR